MQSAANAAAPYASEAIGRTFGHGENKNETAQAVGHFLLGAAIARINGGNFAAGGSAAVAAEKAAEHLAQRYNDGKTAIDPQTGEFNANLLPEHIKEEIKSKSGVIASLTGAAVGGTPAEAQTGGAVGQNAVENNAVNQKQTGTINTFIDVFNNTPSKMGQTKVQAAHNAMLRLSNTDWDYTPNVTPYFNLSKSRYIYTSKAGWIDIVHFLFYASIAYREKIELIKKNDVDWKLPFNYGQIRRLSLEEIQNKAINEAIQSGYIQEKVDSLKSKHSAYSYEDLPSDKYGAIFGAKYFNPKTQQTFGEQINYYFTHILKAQDPKMAPNYSSLPKEDLGIHSGIVNKTTKPLFTGK